MSKWLSVVALVLLVLCGAMGLRNLAVANAATVSSLNSSVPVIWSNGPGPIPPSGGGGGHFWSNGPGPIPPSGGGGGHLAANGPGPIPPSGGGGGHVRSNGPG